ncbi:hypothetical protein Tco_1067289 [Tanacetum coccineum]|uniref:Uncharacterized protein n=1 Tax=Tanacetum coccineum TaxID=301880 RepID=A0ABQ5HE37_9ASTR
MHRSTSIRNHFSKEGERWRARIDHKGFGQAGGSFSSLQRREALGCARIEIGQAAKRSFISGKITTVLSNLPSFLNICANLGACVVRALRNLGSQHGDSKKFSINFEVEDRLFFTELSLMAIKVKAKVVNLVILLCNVFASKKKHRNSIALTVASKSAFDLHHVPEELERELEENREVDLVCNHSEVGNWHFLDEKVCCGAERCILEYYHDNCWPIGGGTITGMNTAPPQVTQFARPLLR